MSDNITLEAFALPEEHFNNEIIWDNKQDLFTKYFKQTIFNNRYRLAIFDLEDNLDFEVGLFVLNSI
jgi:hypothetical protein